MVTDKDPCRLYSWSFARILAEEIPNQMKVAEPFLLIVNGHSVYSPGSAISRKVIQSMEKVFNSIAQKAVPVYDVLR